MAAVAEYRDDISGMNLTSGSSSAYTLTTFQKLPATPNNGQLIAFTVHATNVAGCYLAADGGTAFTVVSANGVVLPAGFLVAGSCYTAHWAGGSWIMHNLYGNPYNIPLAAGIDYWGTTTPNSAFAFPVGQAISRTTYASLYSLLGTNFGAGDGSTTFNLPDKRGRVSAAVDNMGGASAGIFTPAFGVKVGVENVTLAPSQIPGHTHSGTTGVDSPDHGHSGLSYGITHSGGSESGPYADMANPTTALTGGANVRHQHAFTTDAGAGLGGGAHSNTQPTIVCNYILRIV
jgi:microcystin-dependent protein